MGPRERHWRMARKAEFDVCEANVGAYFMERDHGAALASEASGQRGNSIVRAHSASEDARERAHDTRPEPGSSAPAALASEASGQRGDSIARAPDTRPEPGSSARDPAALKAAFAKVAREHGFDVVGVARPDAIPLAKDRLARFLADGAHGDMRWMEGERRGDPRALWPAVRSVIMLGLNYGTGGDPLA